MKTIMMLSNDNFFARKDGSVDFGSKEDKKWVLEQILDKIVLVGLNTFKTIEQYQKLISSAKQWVIPYRIDEDQIIHDEKFPNVIYLNPSRIDSKDIDINFGGIKTILNYPADRIIVNKTVYDIKEGIPFPLEFFDNYKMVGVVRKPTYRELHYKRK